MKIFLTGGTGYLGEHIARDLIGAGHQVQALIRDPNRGDELAEMGAILVPGDLIRPDGWKHVLEGVDGVVHTGGMVEAWSRNPEQFDRVNVQASLDLLDLCEAAGITKIVTTSSPFALGPSADGEELDESACDRTPSPVSSANHYVRTKTLASRKIRERQRQGSPVMIVFPTILMGPGRQTEGNHTATVISDIGKGKLPGLIGDGQQLWNLVPVASAAAGHRLALERGQPGENYILGGENWTQEKLVVRAAHHMQVSPPTRKVNTGLLVTLASLAEGWARLTLGTPFLTRGVVRLYDENWSFTSDKARRSLGYEPAAIEDTVAKTVTWVRNVVWTGSGS